MKDDDEEFLKTHHWNKKERESHWLLYVLIGILCFVLAWMMSGAMR